MSNAVTDTYGLLNDKRRRRHRLCTCKPVHCFGRFRCRSRRHVGHRSTPFCNGASPGENCDTCWSKHDASRATDADGKRKAAA